MANKKKDVARPLPKEYVFTHPLKEELEPKEYVFTHPLKDDIKVSKEGKDYLLGLHNNGGWILKK